MQYTAGESLEKNEINNNNSHMIRRLAEQWIENRIPAIAYIGILFFIGVIGNLNVLFIFTKYFKASTYRVFVRTLAIVDLLVCVTHMPLEIVYLLKPFGFYSESACKAYRYFVYCINYLSIILITMIAIERYIKICRPLSKWRMSSNYADKFALLATSVALVSAIPSIFTHGNHAYHVGKNDILIMCDIDDRNYKTWFFVSYFALIGVLYIVVTFVLIFTYSSIIKTVVKRERSMVADQSSVSTVRMTRPSESTQDLTLHIHQNSKESHGHLIRTTRTLLIITIIFIIVHAPFFILCIVVGADISFRNNLNNIQVSVFEIGLRLYLINNVTNPIVYGFTDARFQRACISLYRKCQCKRRIGHVS